MPREQRKRGRRAQKQRHEHDEYVEPEPKRLRLEQGSQSHAHDTIVTGNAGDDFIGFQIPPEQQFYGLLDEEEQQYYANVNNKIMANDFDSEEDRDLFIEAVYRESKGKEIKLASSQSCSRYLERLIQISKPSQLRALFAAFLQDLDYLAQHRFGSHCCETLFRRTATYIEKGGDIEEQDSIESLFLQAANLLKKNISYLLTERFASHTVRVLLLVLSGDPLDDPSIKTIIASDKKENLEASNQYHLVSTSLQRQVPDTFRAALDDLISVAASTMDLVYLRSLATHPIGSPALQILLKFELTSADKSRHISDKQLLKQLLPDEDFDAESDTGKFLSGLIYDPTGSHLVETLVKNLPGKPFKRMYKNLFRDRIGKIAKNDIAGHVAIRILERIGKDDLADARDKIMQEVPGLLQRHRLVVIRSLIERCDIRQIPLDQLVTILKSTYGNSASHLLPQLLQPKENVDGGPPSDTPREANGANRESERADVSGSRLAQSMLQAKSTSQLIQESLISQPNEAVVAMSKDPVSSRVLQVALVSQHSDATFLKQLVTKLIGSIEQLAVNPAGSHVVDALWDGTKHSHFLKEKIARELQQSEAKLRESLYGRTVWRNWRMDTYQRRPREWHDQARGLRDQFDDEEATKTKKTPIQLARERHAQKQSKTLQQPNENNLPSVSAHA